MRNQPHRKELSKKQDFDSQKGSIRLKYLSKMKEANKSSRFNEDLTSEYSHVLHMSNNVKRDKFQALSQRDNQSIAPSNVSQRNSVVYQSSKSQKSKLTSEVLSKYSSMSKSQNKRLMPERASQIRSSIASLIESQPEQRKEELGENLRQQIYKRLVEMPIE